MGYWSSRKDDKFTFLSCPEVFIQRMERILKRAKTSDVPKGLLTPNPKARLREQVREVLRFHHYSLRTEKAYWQWIRRYPPANIHASLHAFVSIRLSSVVLITNEGWMSIRG
jgi:hypothetical protein